MITFDLACEHGHRFEGWFRNREDFEDQQGRGLLSCPICGSARIEKQLSAVSVHVSRRTAADGPAPERPSRPSTAALPSPGQKADPRPFFRALAEFVEANFEDVGDRFAEEARRVEQGEAEARNIRGTTTAEEEEALRDEGIEFMKIPVPKYDA